jgi:penicillin amidase
MSSRNRIYADVRGNIDGCREISLRKSVTDASLPGWLKYDWDGAIPLRYGAFNPPEGIATANNRIPPAGYPYLITSDWDYGYRAQRIVDLIQSAPGKINIGYIQTMQADDLDPIARTVVPILLETVKNTNSPVTASAYKELEGWDNKTEANSPGAAIFEATWNHLLQNTFNDDLPLRYQPEGGDRWMEIMRRIISEPASVWWDDQSTTDRWKPDLIFERSFRRRGDCKCMETIQLWSWGSLTASRSGWNACDRNGMINLDAGPSLGGAGDQTQPPGWRPRR